MPDPVLDADPPPAQPFPNPSTPPAEVVPGEVITDAHVESFPLTANVTPAPGPGARVGRTAGQMGGTLVFVQLWQAFEWFGADSWTDAQRSARWPAVTAVVLVLTSAAQNLIGYKLAQRKADA